MQPQLIEGSGGVFDVVVDGQEVYSKFNTGRHANPGEVIALVNERNRGK